MLTNVPCWEKWPPIFEIQGSIYNIFDRKFVFFTKQFWPKILNFDFSSSRSQILNELATCIKGAIDADGFNLYIVSEMHKDFYKYVHPDKMSEEELP